MRHAWWLTLPLLAALAFCFGPNSSRAEDKGKGTVVEMDGMKATTPASWKEEPLTDQSRQFGRYAQFRLPKVGDDKEDATLIVYKGFGGTAKDNITRWKGQFQPPEGKKVDDVARVSDFKVGNATVNLLDIHGTYLARNPPFDPNAQVEKHPDYRMLAAQFDGKDTVYHLKLVGPAKTVEHYQKGFEEWLKSFK